MAEEHGVLLVQQHVKKHMWPDRGAAKAMDMSRLRHELKAAALALPNRNGEGERGAKPYVLGRVTLQLLQNRDVLNS